MRIISLVPSQTELLYDLGLEASIVGITKFCVHPIHLLKTKTIVGGTKQIHIQKIKALQPDIILCNKEENTKDIVVACEAICMVHVSDIVTIKDCVDMILQYGEMFYKENEASKICEAIQKKVNEFQSYIKDKPTLKVAYFIWRNPWMVAGNNTFINYLLQLNKLDNVFKNLERYPEIEFNKLLINQPEVILLSSEPYPFKQEHVLEMVNTIQNTKAILVDGEYFSWYGSRLVKAFDYFKKLRNRL